MAPGPRTPPPYGGPEETSEVRRVRERRSTHPSLPYDQRIMVVEERAAGAEEVAIGAASELSAVRVELADLRKALGAQTTAIDRLTTALNGPDHQPEHGLLWKVMHLHTRSRKVDKIVWSALTAAVLGLAAWVLKLYAATQKGG